MARAIWTGSLSFGLVNVPVGLYAATDDKSIHFNQFQSGTQDRVRNKRVNENTGVELDLQKFASFGLSGTLSATYDNTLANYMRDVLFPAGYVEVKAPLIFNKALWETSGHWAHYRQNMFLIQSEDEQMAVKAMNCPGHMLIFGSEVRSYRDLPLRLFPTGGASTSTRPRESLSATRRFRGGRR